MSIYLLVMSFFCFSVFFLPPKPTFSYSYQHTALEWTVLGLGISAFIQVQFDIGLVINTDNTSIIYLLMIALILLYVVYILEKRRLVWFLLGKNPTMIKSSDEFSKYVYCLIVLIERSDDVYYKNQLHTVLKSFHASLSTTSKLNKDWLKDVEQLIIFSKNILLQNKRL